MRSGFDRKIFSARLFWSDIGYLLANAPAIAGAMRNPSLGRVFMEKTMIVVTAINGCTYCSWFHARQGAASGMSEDEIQRTFGLQFDTEAGAYELPALSFAQHYAETDRHPEPDEVARLNAFYGEPTASHIMLFIRMIFFGNLYGNTFDAFLSRLKGAPAPQSRPVFETLFFLFAAPVMLPAKWLMDRQNRAL